MQYCDQGMRIGPSSCGLGVFAVRTFRVHDMIGPIFGTVIDDPRYQSEYCMELGECSALEPDSPFRYVNHSCQPNCALVEIAADGSETVSHDGTLWLEVIAKIAPGDQLTIDYAWPACAAIPCACGCPECRGWIVAEEDRNKLSPSPGVAVWNRTPRRYRHHLRRLYRLWAKWNQKFFAGKLALPAIVLSQLTSATAYGNCGPASNSGNRSQIRLQLSLLTGTHPNTRADERNPRKRYRIVAEVLLHEMVHQWGREVASDDPQFWRHHGESFSNKCNEIGRQLRLLPVSSARAARQDPSLTSCARWPHSARRRAAPASRAV